MPVVRLKQIVTRPFAIWVSFISALFGILFGIVFGFMSFLSFGLQYTRAIFLWILVTPTVFAAIGLLASLNGALVYNALVRNRDGILFEIEEGASKVELPP